MKRENATKLKFTASSISSMHINRTMMFLRFRNTPATAIANRMPDSASTWVRVIMGAFSGGHLDDAHAILGAHRDLRGDVLRFVAAAAAQRQDDGGDARHQKDHGGELRGIGVAREQRRAQRAGIGIVRRAARGAELQVRAAQVPHHDHVDDGEHHESGDGDGERPIAGELLAEFARC